MNRRDRMQTGAITANLVSERDHSLFRALIRTTSNGIIVTDRDGLVLI